MKTIKHIKKGLLAAILLLSGAAVMAQAPLTPPPFNPNPDSPPGQLPPPGPPGNPGTPPPPPNPGTPPGWGAPGSLSVPPSADWMNQGTLNVMATGYDSEGVMRQLPLYISYTFNGVNYNITVLNSWNPYTQSWNVGVDIPAYSTSYYLNGFTYNYYAMLPIGTFYFNL